MRILVVTQYYWPENFRINDLTTGLIEKGHQVTVLTGIPNYPEGCFFAGYGFFKRRYQNYKGVNIIRVPLIPRGSGTGFRLMLNYLSFAICGSLLAPLFCQQQFDLIFVFEPSPITVGLPAIVLKKLKSIPIVFWVQDLWPESLSATGAITSNRVLKLVEKLVKFIYRNCDMILVTSQSYFNPIKKLGVSKNDLRYFPQSVEEVYEPVTVSSAFQKVKNIPDGFRVMFAGNIGTAQSFETIIQAAEKLKGFHDIHWIIIGDGRMYSWVMAEIKRRKLHNTFHLLGRHALESMPMFFALADTLLVSLKKDPIFSLTIPGKVQSYIACGKPVIASLDGEGRRLIEDSKAGFTSPAEDANALANATLKMYKMTKDQRKIMGENGLEYYKKNFSRDMLICRLEGWMKEISKTGK
jgi:colanic acid biosynthesis glycosyl transferase WcaI